MQEVNSTGSYCVQFCDLQEIVNGIRQNPRWAWGFPRRPTWVVHSEGLEEIQHSISQL